MLGSQLKGAPVSDDESGSAGGQCYIGDMFFCRNVQPTGRIGQSKYLAGSGLPCW